MKRALLIAGGTVGGLGAVLAITPPQITANESLAPSAPVGLTELDTPSAAPVETQSATPQATATKKAAATKSATPKASVSATPAPVATKVAATKGVSGAFIGSAVDIGYGIMQVKITVVNGKITEAEAVQTPSGRNDRWTNMAVPVLRQRTLAAQSANINGVSGASYTSYGWYTSLVSALKQAGL
ncbi:FMN-binding [Candidatus Nanopelagicaceae bacterium]